jgi:membrane protein DedA with SNARE-associated domain
MRIKKMNPFRFIGMTGWGLIAVAVLLLCLGIIGGFKLDWAIGAGMYIMLVGASLCAVASIVFKPAKQ